MRFVFLVLMCLLALSPGCTSAAERARLRRVEYLKLHPDTTSDVREAIEAGKVIVGMTEEEAEASWGRPRFKRVWNTPDGQVDVWQYTRTVGMPGGGYAFLNDVALHMVDGKVDSWIDQDTDFNKQSLRNGF